jgi:DNA-binding response OmpR family regulator
MSHQIRVLLAEDDPGVRRSLALVLESAGYDVTTAEHGIHAMFLLQKILPQILIYELNLPDVRGHDFLSIVRARFPQIAVVLMTGLSELEGNIPDGVFADAIYIKGQTGPEALLQTLSELIQTTEVMTKDHKSHGASLFAAGQRVRRAHA